MAGLPSLNALPADAAREALLRCCGSSRWADGMLARRPFASDQQLLTAADEVWRGLSKADYLEAFSHHPKIGGKDQLRQKFQSTRAWAQQEQAGAAAACEATLDALTAGNDEYEKRFGFIFIVCAAGKSADEMLALLRARMNNAPEAELAAAAAEQAKITALRLKKLLDL